MKRLIIAAAAALGLFFAAGAALAPAEAAPLPSGVAQSVAHDQGAVEQANWRPVRCGRHFGGRRHCGWGFGFGHRHHDWRHHGHIGRHGGHRGHGRHR